MASLAVNYEIGDMFKSTRWDDEFFYVKELVVSEKATASKKGKLIKPKANAYMIGMIPEVVNKTMPNGSIWTHQRKPFMSNDDIIAREISSGSWVKID